jgi:hypothetical protein
MTLCCTCTGCSWVTICSEMAGTELKLSDAGKFRQLREFPCVHDPASAFVASIAIAIARADGIQALINPSQAWTIYPTN